MKINEGKNNQSFKGIMTNKRVLRGLETISEHGASFSAGVSFVMASGLRPVTISLTPDVKKENKQYAITNSIASGLVKFAIVETVALPFEHSIKKLEKNPDIYLKSETIDKFKKNKNNINQSKNFKFITQILKQSVNFITAIPKSIATVALIPIFMDKLFSANNKKNKHTPPSFKGNISDIGAKGTAKLLDLKWVQDFAEKFSSKHQDITRNVTIATDTLLTTSFAFQTNNSKKIDEKRKKPLIVNNTLGTIISIAGGFAIDKHIKNNTKNFIKEFSEVHKNDPKLLKYIEGINIVRPTMIFALIYYGILPMITTYLADKTDK